MKSMKIVLTLLTSLALTACGAKVEVPPAHVGKILTSNGYAPETIQPSKFRLPACFAYCDKLVILEASDRPFKETMTLFMPQDKLNLKIEVRGTYTVPTDDITVSAIFDRVPSVEKADDTSLITAKMVYDTYGQQALRGVVRSELVKHTIPIILEQREAIGGNTHAVIAAKLKSSKTPIIISRFQLADIQPPAVIVNAQQAAKEREIDIEKANADAEVDLVKATRDLEVAQKNRLVETEKAHAIAEQNEIASESITPQLLAYRKLETAERIYLALAKSDNVIIIPADSSGFSNTTDNAVLAKLLGGEFMKAGKK